MIALEQVSVRYRGGNTALKEVTLTIEPGEMVALLGSSGAGKSTIIRLLTRELKPSAGRVVVDGVDLKTLSTNVLRLYREKLGIVFQDLRLIPHLTVIENVALPLELRGLDPREIALRIEPVLNHLGLLPWARSFPHTLSAGRQRLTAVARAIVSNPAIILADDPTDDLDPMQQQLIISLLQDLRAQGTTVLVATHSPEIASALRGRIIGLQDGAVMAQPAGIPRPQPSAPKAAPKPAAAPVAVAPVTPPPAPTPAAAPSAPKVKITAIRSEE